MLRNNERIILSILLLNGKSALKCNLIPLVKDRISLVMSQSSIDRTTRSLKRKRLITSRVYMHLMEGKTGIAQHRKFSEMRITPKGIRAIELDVEMWSKLWGS